MVEAYSWLCRRSANPMCLNKLWLPRLVKVSHLCMHGTSCLIGRPEMTPFLKSLKCVPGPVGLVAMWSRSGVLSKRQCSRCWGPCCKGGHFRRVSQRCWISCEQSQRVTERVLVAKRRIRVFQTIALEVPPLGLTLQGLGCHSRANSVHQCGVV